MDSNMSSQLSLPYQPIANFIGSGPTSIQSAPHNIRGVNVTGGSAQVVTEKPQLYGGVANFHPYPLQR